MANRAAIVGIALVVGVGLYAGATVLDDRLGAGPAAGGEVVAENTTMHLDRVGRPSVVGEVINGRRASISNVTVTVTFYEDGTRIGTASDTVLVPTVLGGASAPFEVRLQDRSARPDDYEVTVEYDAAAERPYAGLSVVDSRLTDTSQEQVVVVGGVENGGDERVGVHVVATFYGANGSVLGARSVRSSPSVLGPGETGQFRVRFRTLGNIPTRADDVSGYELIVYGEEASG